MIYFNNDTRVETTPILDLDGDPVTTGTVEIEVLDQALVSTLIAATAMTHQAGGVWRKDYDASDINALGSVPIIVNLRVTVGAGTPNASFVRSENYLIVRR